MYNPYVTHWHAIILGTVEGVTEFLPISSTAHLIITSRVLGLQQTQFQTLFEVCIQVGAIAAVLVLYCRTLLLRRAALLRVFTAFVPTAVIGLMLHSFIKDVLFDSLATILWSLLLGGIIILLFEHYHTERSDAHDDISRLPYKTAFFIGCCQSLAVIPGVSRAAATIIGGQLLSVSRRTIVDFSFLLAVPTMAAAAVLDSLKTASALTASNLWLLVLGTLVSFLVALAAVKWLLKYIKNHSFSAFGWYRIILALVGFWLLL